MNHVQSSRLVFRVRAREKHSKEVERGVAMDCERPSEHDYEAVLAYYASHPHLLKFDPEDEDDRSAAHLVSKAEAHLCLGDLTGALNCLEKSAAIRKLQDGTDHVSMNRLWAVIRFLTGNTDAAIAFHKDIIEKIVSREITWTDGSGGAGDALLLWYYANVGGYAEGAEIARRFIRRPRTHELPPGPVARLVIGEINEEEMLKTEFAMWKNKFEVGNWAAAREGCKQPGPRSMLGSASFYAAFARGLTGDECRRQELMKYSATLEPWYGPEWFLARRECNMPFRWQRREH